MALIKCKECGKEVSDKADRCPNCGCPVSYSIENTEEVTESTLDDKFKEWKPSTVEMVTNNTKDNKKKEKKKDSALSMIAFVISLLGCGFLSILGAVLAFIDLKNKDDNREHGYSTAAIIVMIIWWILIAICMHDGDNDVGNKTDNSQLNILLAEDENVSVYLDHIENGKIYIKYENHSDTNINIQYSDLTINGTRYYKGIFVDEVYSQDDLVKKLSLYDKEGKSTNYKYENGMIKGKFEYFSGGIGFVTELSFDEIEF